MRTDRPPTERLARLKDLPSLGDLPDDALLDAATLGLLLGVSPKTLANQRSAHVGIPYHRFGRAVRYAVRDVRSAMSRVAP